MLNLFGWIALAFRISIYQPLLNALILIYNYLPGRDFGLAIIILTAFVRLLLYPLNQSAIRSQKELAELQPKLKKIQETWKNDKERQVKETLAIYKEAKINPLASVGLTLIQLPILIAMFRVFQQAINQSGITNDLYSFVPLPQGLKFLFLEKINLAQPNIILTVAAGAFQFWQARMLIPKEKSNSQKQDINEIMQKQSVYFMPLLTIFILFRLPSALALYWLATGIFSIAQQYALLKRTNGYERRKPFVN